MTRGTRLELTWVGKHDQPRLEPRILLEDTSKSYCAKERVSESDRFDNMLIHGDNLLALKALEHDYAGKVKCVCIDPPYNTGSAFGAYYDDGMEHSLWLSMMRDRLVEVWQLLSVDGTVWIFVDDNEFHYLKVMCDEIFGRVNFVQSVVWQRKASPANDAKWLSNDHDYILVYAREKTKWRPNRLPRSDEQTSYYSNPDNDPRGDWNSVTYTCNKTSVERPGLYYAIRQPVTGEEIWPSKTAVWRCGPETHAENVAGDLLYWGKDGRSRVPRLKRFLADARNVVPRSVWPHDEVGHTQGAMLEQKLLSPTDPFPTPKTEAVAQRILHIATNPGDLVLDSFAGSGTTGAVAHKMGRRWIMVELGDHCDTHVVPRLRKVIDGTDAGGVTEATGWKGGGGFRYYNLAPSLLEKDGRGQWIISRQYNATMLAEAVCKHEGFEFAPSAEVYWKHGHRRDSPSTFIWVTTQTLTKERLERLSAEVGEGAQLMVLCQAFKGDATSFENLVVKKLPTSILDRCEWGKDDYSLKIAALGAAPVEDASPPEEKKSAVTKAKKARGAAKTEAQGDLFAGATKGDDQ